MAIAEQDKHLRRERYMDLEIARQLLHAKIEKLDKLWKDGVI